LIRIAADTSIDNIEIAFGIFGQQPVCYKMHIAISERPVSSIEPAGVGYAVADK